MHDLIKTLIKLPFTVIIFRLHENYELLKSRWLSIQESKEALEIEINRKTQQNRALISDMNSLRPEIKRLHRQREQKRKWLLDRGMSTEELDDLLERTEREG